MLTMWTLMGPFAAIVGFIAAFIMGDIRVLYFLFTRGAWVGVWVAGVRFETVGLEGFDHSRSYIFMTNHVSNIDPPIQVGMIPRQTSVMVKKELFKVPILGPVMRMGKLVPVDRGNRDAGIEAVRAARAVVNQGLNMLVYVEGKRQTAALQERAVLHGRGMWRSGRSGHDCRHALRLAQAALRYQARTREGDLP
jgi:1-acyl-sn-glycerol-3-phosphate acyltransferase